MQVVSGAGRRSREQLLRGVWAWQEKTGCMAWLRRQVHAGCSCTFPGELTERPRGHQLGKCTMDSSKSIRQRRGSKENVLRT